MRASLERLHPRLIPTPSLYTKMPRAFNMLRSLFGLLLLLGATALPVEAEQCRAANEVEKVVETCGDLDVGAILPFVMTGTTTVMRELSCYPPMVS